VISTVRRRRRSWSAEEKVAILDAAFRAGGSVAAAAAGPERRVARWEHEHVRASAAGSMLSSTLIVRPLTSRTWTTPACRRPLLGRSAEIEGMSAVAGVSAMIATGAKAAAPASLIVIPGIRPARTCLRQR
jgi:hypothetical protein